MTKNFILLTGMPGCGKTSLVKKLVDDLKKNKINKIKGFYTEECRNSFGERTGFDIITLDGLSTTLARVSSASTKVSNYKVGKYHVYVDNFENVCMKYMADSNDGSLLVIDEIGKMELLSKSFENFVKSLLKTEKCKNWKILATVPLKANNALIDELKKQENVKLFHVTKSNRVEIYSEIYHALQQTIEKSH